MITVLKCIDVWGWTSPNPDGEPDSLLHTAKFGDGGVKAEITYNGEQRYFLGEEYTVRIEKRISND